MVINKDNVKEYYKYYLEEDDPTEFTFIRKYIGTLEEWEQLCSLPWFKPIIFRWRREIELKIKSKALRALREVALGETRDSFIANKYLLDYSYSNTKTTKGRPTTQQIMEEANKIAIEDKIIQEDWNRINTKL